MFDIGGVACRFSNGNGDQWVQYSLVFQTGSSNTVSVGFKVGSLGGLSPVVGWDSFVIQKVCAGAFDMPLDQSPAWTSVEDAPWGSSGSWQTVSNSHLEAQLGEEGSSARVLVSAPSLVATFSYLCLFWTTCPWLGWVCFKMKTCSRVACAPRSAHSGFSSSPRRWPSLLIRITPCLRCFEVLVPLGATSTGMNFPSNWGPLSVFVCFLAISFLCVEDL